MVHDSYDEPFMMVMTSCLKLRIVLLANHTDLFSFLQKIVLMPSISLLDVGLNVVDGHFCVSDKSEAG